MDKQLNQATMVRTKFRNKFLNFKTGENKLVYAKQRNYCVNLLQQKKATYFENLDLSSIADNTLFWKTVSQLFTEINVPKNNKITLVEGDKVLTGDAKMSETFNSFFVNTLNIEKDESIFCDMGDETDPVLRAYFKNPTEFSFLPIAKEVKNFNTKKAAPQDDIPVKILKLNNDIFSRCLSDIFNESMEAANFPNNLKYAEITLVYKKGNRHEKENYRSVLIKYYICYIQNI